VKAKGFVRSRTNKKPPPGTFQKRIEDRMDAKMDAKLAEFQGRIPATPGNSEPQNNPRQYHSYRHAAPNGYGGAPSGQYPPNVHGQYPTNYGGSPGVFVRPPMVNGNFYRTPSQTPGCFNCGDLTHFRRECPLSQAGQQTSFSQPYPSQFNRLHEPFNLHNLNLHNLSNLNRLPNPLSHRHSQTSGR